MSKSHKIQASDEAWDEGLLGRDEEFVAVDDGADLADLDAGLELQLISIRLSKSLIEDFKNIAQIHGLGYQPLMRQALQRFAEGEKKMLLQATASEHIKNQRQRESDRASQKAAKARQASTRAPAPQHRPREKKVA
ncbi:hypothetical protein [Paraburkholderia humisilvae]|uniref:Uncharacterized protein n=1 Tax=Paraburkholderia humisilvae TaxID=627669 RepID=A0A6J5DKM4_9BURK|nr:hypothetical protein [Paraburkholderia humisilvae]CAB3753791.1 hypothetical protein LMG29542_02167 [Paraburkholderia humisilvae]